MKLHCEILFNPPYKDSLSIANVPQSYHYIGLINAGLNSIQLPENAKRIKWNHRSMDWTFACQTKADLYQLQKRFMDYISQLIHDLNHPEQYMPEEHQSVKTIQTIPTVDDFPPL